MPTKHYKEKNKYNRNEDKHHYKSRDKDKRLRKDDPILSTHSSNTTQKPVHEESSTQNNSEAELIKKRRERVLKWRKERELKEKNEKIELNNKKEQETKPKETQVSLIKKTFVENSIFDETIAKKEQLEPSPVLDSEVDALDAYMSQLNEQVEKTIKKEEEPANNKKRINILEDVADEAEVFADEMENILKLAAKKLKKKEIVINKNNTSELEKFRKNFYLEPEEMKLMSNKEVEELRISLDGIKVKGNSPVKPITKWAHCGLLSGCHDIIKAHGFERPTPIQSQAIPAILSGRDVIGIAKTGSGKTLAYILPMLRHIKDQRPLGYDEGPISMVMTPTRELAMQVYKECKPFLKVLGLRAVCAYGGAPIREQMSELKRGVHMMVCTPGRMIDLLCANSGRMLNLNRVTYLVMDESDRMFDMGFEPQVMDVINAVRPDRQIVMFSATFPRQMEGLVKKVLVDPIEIIVGARSVVCSEVAQIVEVRDDTTKFNRLLEILGNYYKENEDKRALVFVDRQDSADVLLRDLMRKGYISNALHGKKDQSDRDSTIHDFKAGVFSTLVATSVAARGLDVKGLDLVINYDCPNHMEDYVHRVGRTGRAGRPGVAYTFITPDQEKYAPDLIKALKNSNKPISEDLKKLGLEFYNKVKKGNTKLNSSGFGGKGLDQLEKERSLNRFIQKKSYGGAVDEDNPVSDDEEYQKHTSSSNTRKLPTTKNSTTYNTQESNNKNTTKDSTTAVGGGLERAKSIIAELNAKYKESSPAASETLIEYKYNEELEINDYPQELINKITNKEYIDHLSSSCKADVSIQETPANKEEQKPNKLTLKIHGNTQKSIDDSKACIRRSIEEHILS